MKPEELSPDLESVRSDSVFQQQVQRLYRLTIYGRWLVVAGLWLTVGSLSLWELRGSIALIREYFTWAALRYGLLFNGLPALGLALCLSVTISTLIWQCYNLVFGLPPRDRSYLEQQVWRIRQQGSSHPLWNQVCRSQPSPSQNPNL